MKREKFVFFACLAILITSTAPGCNEPKTKRSRTRSSSSSKSTVAKKTLSDWIPSSKLFRGLEIKLSLDKQQAKAINETHSQQKKIIENWYANEGKEMQRIRSKAFSAARKKDLNTFRKMESSGSKSRFDQLIAQERKLGKEYEAAMFASVPVEKLDLLKAHQISTLLVDYLSPLKLTEDQRKSIQDSALSVIEKIKSKKNWRGYGTSQLEKVFENSILLKKQKDQYQKLKKKNKLRMLKWNNL